MLTINPILSNSLTTADYTAAASNINRAPQADAATAESANNVETANSTAKTNSVDDRRYTKFDRTASVTGDAELSFSDILDAINPLQHIPLVSSVYRAIADEDINPVARVTGDIMYGGALGMASAIVGGVASIGDSAMIAKNGQSMAGTIIAAMGSEEPTASDTPKTEVAENTSSDEKVALSPTETAQAKQADAPAVAATDKQPTQTAQAIGDKSGKGYAITPNKQPFGGIMDNSSNAALSALSAQGTHATQLGHTIYTNRLMAGARNNSTISPSSPPAPTSQSFAADVKTAVTATTKNAYSPGLLHDLLKLQEFKSLPSVATASPAAKLPLGSIY